MDSQRTILFVVLSFLLYMLWQAWDEQQRPPATTPATATAPSTQTTAPSLPTATPATAAAPSSPVAGATGLERSERRVRVTTDQLIVEIDPIGGDLRDLSLRRYPVAVKHPDQPFRLLNDQDSAPFFIAQGGLISAAADYWPYHRSRFEPENWNYTLADGQDSVTVRLHWSGRDGQRVTKFYTFHRNSFVVDSGYEVVNGPKAAEVYSYGQLQRSPPPAHRWYDMVPAYTGAAYYTPARKYEKKAFDDMVKHPLHCQADPQDVHCDVKGGWVAMLQHYFVGAWLPPADTATSFYTDVTPGPRYVVGYKTIAPVKLAPGQRTELSSRLYLGPKEQVRLDKAAPGLKLTVDYGMLTFISAPLFWLLEHIHSLVHNWGWAIIVLTILIKLVFYPLSAASYKSMAQMRKLQPRLQALKERYGDDRQKMQQAMMEMYKTEKINPLGGCLPILIQIPVFIALYWVLLESVEMRQADFALWLNDLSSPDPYFVLPVLMGASMLAQTWLNPQPMDPIQQKVMYIMPVAFTAFFAFFPAGLVLYWTVQNLLSILQQWNINRTIQAGAK